MDHPPRVLGDVGRYPTESLNPNRYQMNDAADANPYTPPNTAIAATAYPANKMSRRGPMFYFAAGGFLGAATAIAIIATTPVYADPSPLWIVVALLGVPLGGAAYRFRSHGWPPDPTVRRRQYRAMLATLLLPVSIAAMTGMRAQGFMMTILGAVISLSLVFGILLAGIRRQNGG